MQAFATETDLKFLPLVRVCITSEGQHQCWYSHEQTVKVLPVTEEVILEDPNCERSDHLEMTFFVDTRKLRGAWLAATATLYAAFASRAQAEDPRYTDKVFARCLNMSLQKFRDIVACKNSEIDVTSAWHLKTIESNVSKLRANGFAELGNAIVAALGQGNALKRVRGTPASATDADTPSSEGVEDSNSSVPPASTKTKTKQMRVQFNSDEKKWLKEHVGARITEYKAASTDARCIIVEEVLQEAKEVESLRTIAWSVATMKNQFHNFAA